MQIQFNKEKNKKKFIKNKKNKKNKNRKFIKNIYLKIFKKKKKKKIRQLFFFYVKFQNKKYLNLKQTKNAFR